ncbi:hypothetical protein EDC96DRAFT_494130, partial [Choanephora cucurbitarum]
MIRSFQDVTLSVAFSEISNPNYADGIGYPTTTGVVGEERIVVMKKTSNTLMAI